MKASPFFSIIIPTYNRAEFLPAAIKSVLNQTCQDFELIIVDDGSTDNTESVVKLFNDPRILYFKKKNEERNFARNFGIKKSKGNYINFLDSDDTFYNYHLDEGKKLINKLADPEFLYFRVGYKDEDGNILKSSQKLKGNLNKKLIYANPIQCNGVFIKREILDEIAFLNDSKFVISEDWYLWLKIASRYTLYYSNVITSLITQHKDRSLNTTPSEKIRYCHETLLNELLKDHYFLRFYKKSLSKFIASNYSFIALFYQINNERQEAYEYLLKAFWKYPLIIFQIRFMATLKNLILS